MSLIRVETIDGQVIFVPGTPDIPDICYHGRIEHHQNHVQCKECGAKFLRDENVAPPA